MISLVKVGTIDKKAEAKTGHINKSLIQRVNDAVNASFGLESF